MDMIELILSIEKRPALYISKNYISCLKSFLDGCIFSNPNMLRSHILVDFEIFIKEKYNITSSVYPLYNCATCELNKEIYEQYINNSSKN